MKRTIITVTAMAVMIVLTLSGCGDDITNNPIADDSVPTTPQGVFAKPSDGQVTLEWDEVDGASSYYIYWGTEPGIDASNNRMATNFFPYIHTGLSSTTTYYYRISSVNSAGESPLSTEISARARTLFGKMTDSLLHEDVDYMDCFGYSVATSGDYAIVGAHGDDDRVSNAGCAFIFHRTGPESWDNGTRIDPAVPVINASYGSSVAISDNYAVIGCASLTDHGLNSGAIYIYQRTGVNVWTNEIKIYSPDIEEHDMFGNSVAISGDYVVVGANSEDGGAGNPKPNVGAAYVFHRTGPNEWASVSKLTPPDGMAGDTFGASVSISGDYIVVGSSWATAGAANAGAAYVFHRTDTNTWDAGTKIIPTDSMMNDRFGFSVSISGDYVAVGSRHKNGGDDGSLANAGAAYVFRRTGTNTWGEGTRVNAPDMDANDLFGGSVSIRGNVLLVGAYAEDNGPDSPLSGTGAAYVFSRTGSNTWDNGVKISCPDPAGSEKFGSSVALGDGYALIGAYTDSDFVVSGGKVYFF